MINLHRIHAHVTKKSKLFYNSINSKIVRSPLGKGSPKSLTNLLSLVLVPAEKCYHSKEHEKATLSTGADTASSMSTPSKPRGRGREANLSVHCRPQVLHKRNVQYVFVGIYQSCQEHQLLPAHVNTYLNLFHNVVRSMGEAKFSFLLFTGQKKGSSGLDLTRETR